ncbi:CaiB/BaiF CoA transferase family protein [Bordetella pseudohinzii]|uniref:Formyl-coenzyme A transferase n=1 Tax=Bordetella pseudohinzii TaxID=1331258 RepID=A0A0J6C3P3_9BORD|nr:CoA transferase [Bordetella pseudohinzii]KMM25391.1 carnitine dehydratase [Bordetella pseudohinzii]KXA81279.1 carnitine dehydratase [Bordetella pseudohinzii]CUJ03560.1 Formyl-coenzyme A transferase [Bordetella pseudohinzii]
MPDASEAPCRQGALAGVRVIDLSRVLAGPLCTQMLADHGADVIKIEPPAGDETRGLGPPFTATGDAAYFSAVNRGKRALALDLAHPEGRELLLALLENADVLVENFLPGTMDRWQLDYETVLRPRFPRLVYCAISGFGASGPLGGLPGYDAILQAMCGLMSVNGEAQSGPTRIGVPIVDHLTGYTAMSGILMALLERAGSGRGQRVEATLFRTALSLLVPHAANWMHSGKAPGLLGSAHPNIAPYDKFACRDGLVFLGIVNDRQFRRFCERLGLHALKDDARYASNAARLAHRDSLRVAIESALATREWQALCQELMRAGVPAGPVNTVPEAFEQAHAADMRLHAQDYHGIGPPVALARTPGQPGGAPPRYAQHTEEILTEAGLGPERIARLRDSGVLPRAP